MSGPRSTRSAQLLIKRLKRDCDLEWPGGPDNAGLIVSSASRRWELVTLDRTPAPVITGPSPISTLLRDGFVLIRWPDDTQELFHVETAETQLSHRLQQARVAAAGA